MFEAGEATKLVRGLLSYAVGGSSSLPPPQQGRRCPDLSFSGDAVYNAVTEGRHVQTIVQLRRWMKNPKGNKPNYSSCGDLAHWFLYRMGVRLDWINRDEHDGWHYSGQPGHPAWDNNVTTLVCRQKHGVNDLAFVPDPDDLFLACGDVLVVNTHDPNTTHVSMVYEHIPETKTIISADYGQPGGALRERAYTIEQGRIKIGSRYLDSVLPLLAVWPEATEDPEDAESWAKRMKLAS